MLPARGGLPVTVDPLLLTRDRDAHAVIRGFAYQIDVTLERWLELSEGDELLLEAGEDIDHVARGLLTGDKDHYLRTLEQVKDLSANITLRSAPALEAIASFLEHRTNNPKVHLAFRFTTTAGSGKERPTSLPRPGVEVWEQLRRKSVVDGADMKEALDGIREILSSANQPGDLADATWATFTAFVAGATNDELRGVIQAFEWSLAAPGSDTREATVRERLRERLGSHDSYPYLFLHVCRLLSASGTKCLVRSDLEQVAHARSRDDSALVQQIVVPILDSIRLQIAAPLGRIETGLEALRMELRAEREEDDSPGALQLETSGRLVLEDVPPPLPRAAAPREALVARLLALRSRGRWLALRGGAGTGKSSLIALMSSATDDWFPAVWLRLRDATPNEVAAMVRRLTYALSRWAHREGELGSLVLEDLPRFVSGDLLADALADAFRRHGSRVRIISSSAYSLPSSLVRVVGEELSEEAAPWFEAGDVEHLLLALGAPQDFARRVAPGLTHSTDGHPTLCAALAESLHKSAWQVSAVVDAILKDRYSEELAAEVFERLLRSVEDEACRHLLARAALVRGSIGRQQLRGLADVPPALNVRDDCVHGAVGVWLRPDGEGRVSVSPLLRVGVTDRLDADVARATRVALGESLLSAATVTPADMARSITYFVEAENWDRVTGTLIQALWSLKRGRPDGPNEWSNYFLDLAGKLAPRLEPLWAAIVSAQRIGLALDLANMAGELARVDAALADLETPGWAVTYLAAEVGLNLTHREFRRVVALASGVARVQSGETPMHSGGPNVPHLEIDMGRLMSFLFWRAGTLIATSDEMRLWNETLFALPDSVVRRILEDDHAEQLGTQVANSVWLHHGRPEHTKHPVDWQEVVEALDDLAGRATLAGSELLAAAAMRARTITLAEYMDSRDAAIQGAIEFAAGLTETWPRFLVAEAAAAQRLLAGDREGARSAYLAALPLAEGVTHIEVVDGLLRAACAADDEHALAYASRSLEVAKQLAGGRAMVVARSEYEQGVALLRNGRTHEALAATFDAHERALTALASEDSPTLRALVALGGHSLAYLDSLARTGRPMVIEGKPYNPPQQGMYLNASDKLASYTDDAAVRRSRGILARVAALLGRRSRAIAWGEAVWEQLQIANDAETEMVIPMVADPLSAAALLERRYAKALTILHTAVEVASKGSPSLELGPEQAALQPGLSGAALALLWDEAEGRDSRDQFVREIEQTIEDLGGRRPAGSEMWAACDALMKLARSRPGWKAIHRAPISPDLYAAQNLLASAEDDAEPHVSATLQVVALASVPVAFRAFPSIAAWIAAPAIVAYWKKRLSNEAFKFAAPAHVARVLERSFDGEGDTARTVLNEIVLATGARRSIPAPALAWLRGGAESR